MNVQNAQSLQVNSYQIEQPKLAAYPSFLSYGKTKVGTTSNKSFNITNQTEETISVRAYSSNLDFYLPQSSFILKAGETRRVEVVFKPRTTNFVSSQITFNSSNSAAYCNAIVSGEGIK